MLVTVRMKVHLRLFPAPVVEVDVPTFGSDFRLNGSDIIKAGIANGVLRPDVHYNIMFNGNSLRPDEIVSRPQDYTFYAFEAGPATPAPPPLPPIAHDRLPTTDFLTLAYADGRRTRIVGIPTVREVGGGAGYVAYSSIYKAGLEQGIFDASKQTVLQRGSHAPVLLSLDDHRNVSAVALYSMPLTYIHETPSSTAGGTRSRRTKSKKPKQRRSTAHKSKARKPSARKPSARKPSARKPSSRRRSSH